jgi:hypothetical protein
VKLVWIAGVIALSAPRLQAGDFTLKHLALGPVITLHTTLTSDGKGVRLIATARNESGAPIRHARICILSAAMRKGCLFEMWNTKPWAPRAELTWNIVTSIKTSNLAHGASLLEFEGGNGPEQPAEAATAPTPVPPPPSAPAPIQSRVLAPGGSAVEKPSPPAPDSPAPEILTDETVVKLAKAGLSDDVIVAMINTQTGQYTVTPTAVIGLKQAGVSDKVIAAIVNKSGSAPSARGTQTLQKAIDAADGGAKPPLAGAVNAALPTMRLDSAAKVIGGEWPAKTSWNATFHYHDQKYPPKDAAHAAADIGQGINLRRASRSSQETRPDIVDEWDLIEKYQADVIRLVRVTGPFLYTEPGVPVRFALKDNNLTLILASLGSTNVYNTRLDAKQRATREIQETVLPAIRRFAVVASTDIKNFGVMVAYGSDDSSEEPSTRAEIVALVASSERCRKLADAELTEEEFVDTADVYLMDRDSVSEVRKIKVSISDNKSK